jgi:hypothetical protein
MRGALDRLQAVGDLWAGILEAKQDLRPALPLLGRR